MPTSDGQSNRIRSPLIPLHELAEGELIAPFGSLDQITVSQYIRPL
jgi:hypothetical protein